MNKTIIYEQTTGHLQYANEKNVTLLNGLFNLYHNSNYYYLNKLISHKPDFRFNSNFAGVVYIVPLTCIPNKKNSHTFTTLNLVISANRLLATAEKMSISNMIKMLYCF